MHSSVTSRIQRTVLTTIAAGATLIVATPAQASAASTSASTAAVTTIEAAAQPSASDLVTSKNPKICDLLSWLC